MLQIYNDSFENILPKLEDNTIDCVICDPPYNSTTIDWDKDLDWDFIWNQLKRICKKNANIILFSQGLFMAKLITSNPNNFKYDLVWNKNKCGSPGLAKYRPQKVHENILVFNYGKGIYNPIMEKGEPYHRECKDKEKGYGSGINNHGYGFGKYTGSNNEGTRYPKSILHCSRDFSAQQQVHPTQKPVNLLKWLVKTYSNENDVILDFTMGSGTTGVACKCLNRSFIGIEKESSYFKIAEDRINSSKLEEEQKYLTTQYEIKNEN